MHFLLVSLGVACSTARPVTQDRPSAAVTSPSPSTEVKSQPTQSIRSVDFASFTYPWVEDLGNPRTRFTLTNGELAPLRNEAGIIKKMGVSLARIEYGDVTSDGQEEAMIILTFITGGSATPNAIYVYGLHQDQTKLLWSAATGDRADGGLHKVYAEDGHLVVERFSPVGTKGDCCPTHFTRTRFEWIGSRFRQKGKQETFPIPE
jgi:hypothetical protein